MWDPSIGLGTVTHQNVGYLWPIGPFFWLLDRVGVPDWAAQRIWWGTIIFAAGAGVVYLLRTLGWGDGPGVTAATFVYALTPYLLTLVARLSAILLPFVALPWLVALTIRTARTKGWRYPALFAITVATCGSVNATALLLVGVAPVLWLAHAVWVARRDLPPHRDPGRPADRGPHRAPVRMVDRRAVRAGHQRHRDPPLHRDGADGGGGVGQPRGAPRPRVLVLLRRRPPRPLDRAERRLHPVPAAHRPHLPAPVPRADGGRGRPVAPPRLLRAAPGRGRGPRRGRVPVGRRLGLVAGAQGVRGVRRRAVDAQPAPRRPARRPRPGGAARCGRDERDPPMAAARVPRLGRRRASSPSWRCRRSGSAGSCPRTCADPRRSPTTGTRPPTTSTAATTAPGCSSCPAATSPATAGATRSTPSSPASWTAPPCSASSSRTARRRPPTSSTPSTSGSKSAPPTPAASPPSPG